MSELQALRKVYKAAQRLRMTAPVDDDFPEMMHNFDASLRAAKPFVEDIELTVDSVMEVSCRMSQELQELMDDAKAAGSDLSGVQALINDFDQLHKLWVNGK